MQGTLGSFHLITYIFTRTEDQLQSLLPMSSEYCLKMESYNNDKEKKKDCRLTSIVIGEVLLVPGEEGAPPGTRHSRFGDVIRRADHGAILPSKV